MIPLKYQIGTKDVPAWAVKTRWQDIGPQSRSHGDRDVYSVMESNRLAMENPRHSAYIQRCLIEGIGHAMDYGKPVTLRFDGGVTGPLMILATVQGHDSHSATIPWPFTTPFEYDIIVNEEHK